jgi:hypothetical protein
MDQARAKEPLGKSLVNLWMELFKDLPAALDPARLSAHPTGNGGRGKFLLPLEGSEDLKLLPERRAPSGIVALESLQLPLETGPRLDDDPRSLSFRRPQREVTLEAVDQDETPGIFYGDERVIDVDRRRAVVLPEELQRDLPESDFA